MFTVFYLNTSLHCIRRVLSRSQSARQQWLENISSTTTEGFTDCSMLVAVYY